eukprot:6471054-Amphidinium_carterae.1
MTPFRPMDLREKSFITSFLVKISSATCDPNSWALKAVSNQRARKLREQGTDYINSVSSSLRAPTCLLEENARQTQATLVHANS